MYSFALDTAKASTDALEAVCEPYNGETPDATFTCAGASRPMFFVEMTDEDLIKGMNDGYWIQAWTAWVRLYKFVTIPCTDIDCRRSQKRWSGKVERGKSLSFRPL